MPIFFSNFEFLVAYEKKNNKIILHLKKNWTHNENFLKSAGDFLKSGNFLTHAQNFRTHAGNSKQYGSLLCHMIENKYNNFVQSKFPDTCWKFQDTVQKLLQI